MSFEFKSLLHLFLAIFLHLQHGPHKDEEIIYVHYLTQYSMNGSSPPLSGQTRERVVNTGIFAKRNQRQMLGDGLFKNLPIFKVPIHHLWNVLITSLNPHYHPLSPRLLWRGGRLPQASQAAPPPQHSSLIGATILPSASHIKVISGPILRLFDAVSHSIRQNPYALQKLNCSHIPFRVLKGWRVGLLPS